MKYNNYKDITISVHGYGFEILLNKSSTQIQSKQIVHKYRRTIYGVGYIGEGEFTPRSHSKECSRIYDIWNGMIQRCYDKVTRGKHLSYSECSVDERWHNFQNFVKWYINHEMYGLGYHLDKDLKIRDNKVYSEDACLMLPSVINYAIINTSNSGQYKKGAYYRKEQGYFVSMLSVNGKIKHLGTFINEDDAHNAYLEARKSYIENLAEEWKHKVCSETYVSLLRYSRF